MSLINIRQLEKAFGDCFLFHSFSTHIAREDRIALIGENGSGKSTLLRILAGLEEPTSGTLERNRNIRIGYLPQIARLDGEGALYDVVKDQFSELLEKEHQLRHLEKEIATSSNTRLMEHYDELLYAYEKQGGYEIDARIRSALSGVGFSSEDNDKPVCSLSGGEEARAALASILVNPPDLLLLDEPANHLDFDGLDWLEERLASFSGAMVIVSHDRHLLNRVASRTWIIACSRISTYRLGYSASQTAFEEEIRQSWETYEAQQKYVKKQQEFIRRNKAGQKHRQAKDRERKLEHIKQDLVSKPEAPKKMKLDIRTGTPSGREVLKTESLQVGYDSVLFSLPKCTVYRGERIAIIGGNGSGKTTLLRTLTREIPAITGEMEYGHNVSIGYYRQYQRELYGDRTVLSEMLSRSMFTVEEARSLLGKFLFSGDKVEKRMDKLSGGERSRIALAELSLIEGNLLLLDEPTNHLDLSSQEILQQALLDYEGTILLVSHDRALLEAVATQIWQVSTGQLRVFRMGYREYRQKIATQTSSRKKQIANRQRTTKPTRKTGHTVRQTKDLRRELRLLEEKIAYLEDKQSVVEQQLVDASNSAESEQIAELGVTHESVTQELDRCWASWGAISEQLEGR